MLVLCFTARTRGKARTKQYKVQREKTKNPGGGEIFRARSDWP
jgi:hypothetical protein